MRNNAFYNEHLDLSHSKHFSENIHKFPSGVSESLEERLA